MYYFVIFFIPFLVAHLANGVYPPTYLKSSFLLLSVFVFCLAFYQFLENCRTIRSIYRNILLFNAGMVLVALIALAIPPLKNIFWYANEITSGVHTLRLRLLTYEPSYYATLLMPIALYYYLKLIVLRLPDPQTTFLLITIPFLMAFSFGGMLGLILSLLLTLLVGYRRFFSKTISLYLLLGGVLLITVLIATVLAFPHNVIVIRFTNIFRGTDTSFRGRTFESFYLGWKIAGLKSVWFGCGPGQVKEIGLGIFRELYNYPQATKELVVIPNSLGDTLAVFGIVGLSLRLFLEGLFFFKTKVFSNYYRLSLFLFIFIYQFTGSYLTNIAEYVIWILAFHKDSFEEFDKARFLLRRPGKTKLSPLNPNSR